MQKHMVDQLAEYVAEARYEALSEQVVQQLKIHILDSLGCAFGALGAPPIRAIRDHLEDFGGAGQSTLIGGGRSAPDRAAFYNGALVRYLDYNDSYLAEGETCHPSDNLGAVLAAAEYAGADGRRALTALAVAYHVHCRLSDVAPVRHKGFDHTTQGSYAVAAGVAKALDLDADRTANALSISGTAYNALRVTRTGALSHWKGLAYPNTAFCGTHATFLAMRGITGPPEVFEGNKGFMDSISGPFEIDWSREGLDRVQRTIIKQYNAEIHSQTALEGLLELIKEHNLKADQIEAIELETFDVAYNIIGGGEEGEKVTVRTKEEADHSLPYMLAVAALDGTVGPAQYAPERIQAEDVQSLLRRVHVRPSPEFSRRFPEEMACKLTLRLQGGKQLEIAKRDYHGFFTRPFEWADVVDKFERLSEAQLSPERRRSIESAVEDFENGSAAELTRMLEEKVGEHD